MTDLRKAAEMMLFRLLGDENHDIQLRAAIALLQALAHEEKPLVKSYCGGKPNYCTPEVTPEVIGEAFALDRGCWERGCVAYDERDGDGVTVSIREWVGLTDEEVCEMDAYTMAITDQETLWLYRFARAIEAKLKEKNSGS